ncbi:MAG: hypothetical protein WKF71_11735 [Pyrinomonadaceae bacterium]
MKIFSFFVQKIFAVAADAISPRSFKRTASSKPFAFASSSARIFSR